MGFFSSSGPDVSNFFSASCVPGAARIGTVSVRRVPRPEVLHSPAQLPLWDVTQRTVLQQPRGAQVSLIRVTSHDALYLPRMFYNVYLLL